MKKLLLTILDGWGIGDGTKSDAISVANTAFMKSLAVNHNIGKSKLQASGEFVGLPDGQMGNSEVGHLNIGAGRIVYQDLVRINMAVKDGSIAKNETLIKAYKYAKENNKAVHFIGLVSDGGVHSSTKHLMALCDLAKATGLEKVYIHVLTDGRDTDPRSGYDYVKELENYLVTSVGKIVSLCGRYYTMDRDKRWERVKQGYDLMVNGIGKPYKNVLNAIADSYNEEVTDEFIKPVIITDQEGRPIATIQPNDVVICFNF
ncbi:MAG TPA: 2,3-bisphosphoglycerate-independent phosphoglycerate mutase, partial [Bacteroidales bacterium]|nr:2,3-bisphosphoglycerate-independent phosphoglycerate mutase [Bacteroidales bacterium]